MTESDLIRELEAALAKLDKTIQELEQQREAYMAALVAAGGSTVGQQVDTVDEMPRTLPPRGRLALSEYQSPVGTDPFLDNLREKGFPSLRELAKEVMRPDGKQGVSAAFLSRVRSGRAKMPTWLAEEIERLTGWPRTSW